MTFLDYFPVDMSPRRVQIEALARIEDALVTRNQRVFVLDAPTGSGKSAIGRTVARAFGTAFVTSPLNFLVDQYEAEASELAAVKGKANYTCTAFRFPEWVNAQDRTCEAAHDMDEALHREICRDYCPTRDLYWTSPLSVTNVDFCYWAPMPPRLESQGGRDYRSVLIIDECHGLEEKLLDLGRVQITARQAVKVGMPPPNAHSREEAERLLESFIYRVGATVRTRGFKNEAEARRFKRKAQALKLTLEIGDWIHWTDRQTGTFIVKPMDARIPAERLFAKADKLLFMSATIGSIKQFVAGLHLQDEPWSSYAAPSDFPVANRQVAIVKGAPYVSKDDPHAIPAVIQGCRQVLRHFSTSKGAILSHSYEMKDALVAGLSAEFGDRIVTHARQGTADDEDAERQSKDQAIQRHCEALRPTVLLGVHMFEGLDLRDDLARFVVIPKVPYPYRGDPYVAERRRRNTEWVSRQVGLKMVQGAGRGMRSATDHCQIFVMDACFWRELREHSAHYPRWFLDAVVGLRKP